MVQFFTQLFLVRFKEDKSNIGNSGALSQLAGIEELGRNSSILGS